MKQKKLKIQPIVNSDGMNRLKYPYYIDNQCNVLRQDFWNGKPKKCIGFCYKGKQEIKVLIQDIFANPNIAKNIINRKLYPIFLDDTGEIYNLSEGKFRCTFVN